MKAMNWERAFAALERLTVTQLRRWFGEIFGEETNGRNKAWLAAAGPGRSAHDLPEQEEPSATDDLRTEP